MDFFSACTEIGLWLENGTNKNIRGKNVHLRCFQNDKIRLPTFVRYPICIGGCKHFTDLIENLLPNTKLNAILLRFFVCDCVKLIFGAAKCCLFFCIKILAVKLISDTFV